MGVIVDITVLAKVTLCSMVGSNSQTTLSHVPED